MISPVDSRYRETLQKLLTTSDAIREDVARALGRPFSSPSGPHHVPVDQQPTLPPAQPLTGELTAMGLPEFLANRISDAYLSSAEQLRLQCEANIRKVSAAECISKDRNGSVLIPRLQTVFQKRYESILSERSAQVLETSQHFWLRNSHRGQESRSARNVRTPFNHQFTPLLEQYFEHNAYPPAADRAVLAEKTKMKLRQIEVWFQNHRNRRKDSKKPLLRLSPNSPLPFFLSNSLHENLPSTTSTTEESQNAGHSQVVSDFSKNDGNDDHRIPISSPTSDLLDIPRPVHAFPTPFSLNRLPDPFLRNVHTFAFPSSLWRRTPTSSKLSGASIDVDELCKAFSATLYIHDGNAKRKNGSSKSTQPWFYSTLTIPCNAPLPALMRPRRPTSSIPFSLCSSPRRLPSPSLGCRDQQVTRKQSGFPKRTPSRVPAQLNGEGFASWAQWPSDFRTASSGSTSSTGTRSTSTSSLSSSGPTTPSASPHTEMQTLSETTFPDLSFEIMETFFNPSPPNDFTNALSHIPINTYKQVDSLYFNFDSLSPSLINFLEIPV